MTGFIGVGQLKYILTNLGEKMTDDEVDELLKAVDTSSGQVNYTGEQPPLYPLVVRSACTNICVTRSCAHNSRQLSDSCFSDGLDLMHLRTKWRCLCLIWYELGTTGKVNCLPRLAGHLCMDLCRFERLAGAS